METDGHFDLPPEAEGGIRRERSNLLSRMKGFSKLCILLIKKDIKVLFFFFMSSKKKEHKSKKNFSSKGATCKEDTKCQEPRKIQDLAPKTVYVCVCVSVCVCV